MNSKKIFAILLVTGHWSLVTGGILFSQMEYTAIDLRDPFESQLPKIEKKIEVVPQAPKEPVKLPQITIESLMAGGRVPMVIIDNKLLRINDEVKGAVITDITKDGVWVIYQEEKFLLPAPSAGLLIKPSTGEKDVKENLP